MEKEYFKNGGRGYIKAVFAGDDEDRVVYSHLIINEKWSDEFIRGYVEGVVRGEEHCLNPYVRPFVDIYFMTKEEWLEEQADDENEIHYIKRKEWYENQATVQDGKGE